MANGIMWAAGSGSALAVLENAQYSYCIVLLVLGTVLYRTPIVMHCSSAAVREKISNRYWCIYGCTIALPATINSPRDVENAHNNLDFIFMSLCEYVLHYRHY
jgi:hypothetical protein